MDVGYGIANTATQTNAVKFYYSKRKESSKKEERRSATRRQVLCSGSAAPLVCNTENLEIGSYYEIDHDKLPPKAPIHLKAVRVVKVTEKTTMNVTVSFPSTYSLRSYFTRITNTSNLVLIKEIVPELDERFVMSTNYSKKILRKLVPSSQLNEQKLLQSFWLVAPFIASNEEDEVVLDSKAPLQTSTDGLLVDLKCSGMQWGVRKKVQYIGKNHQKKLLPPLVVESPSVDASNEDVVEEEEGEEVEEEEEEEEETVEVKNVILTKKRTRDRKKKIKDEKRMEKFKRRRRKKARMQTENENGRKGPSKGSKERWSNERYKTAELRLLDIMKEKGAVPGNPILRQDLRDEARNHIGDTGLLDHLLKHMAGKVVNEGRERFMRRHNGEGVMEYWLEPKEFDELRKTTGGNDPYWNDPYWAPPIGWKSGDGSHDACVCGGGEGMKEVEQIKEDIFGIKRDIEEINSILQMKSKDDDQTKSLCNKLQENYESLLKKNSKQEEEIAGLVSSLKEVKEEMRSLKQEIEKKTTNSSEMNINETTIITPVVNGIKTSISPHINEAAKNKRKGLMNQRSGFKIYCKPQGTILWPELKSTSTIDHGTSVDTTTANEALTAPAEKSSEFDVMFGGSGIPTPPSCSSITSPPKLIALPSNTASVVLPLQFNDHSNVYASSVCATVPLKKREAVTNWSNITTDLVLATPQHSSF